MINFQMYLKILIWETKFKKPKVDSPNIRICLVWNTEKLKPTWKY